MIDITVGANGEPIASQRLVSPTIYLDHWALRAASKDRDLAERLTRAIEARGGTLVVSWANISEFPSLDQKSAREAEEFIDGNLPRVFFSDFNAFDVIQRENALIAGGPPFAPHADLDLFKLVVGLRPSGVQPVTCIGMLTEVTGQRSESTERMKATFVERMGRLREDYLGDEEFRALVDRSIKGQPAPRGTFIVLRELVAGLMRDKGTAITPNDALDFFHTVVPVSYCDIVLLDGRWRDQVDRLRIRLKRIGLAFPLATTLSGGDAVERLLGFLEGNEGNAL